MTKPKNGWGGIREGAGAKPLTTRQPRCVRVTTVITADVAEWLDRRRGNCTRSEYLFILLLNDQSKHP